MVGLFPHALAYLHHCIHEAFARPILGSNGIVQPVPSEIKTAHPDVLAEFGFRLASLAYQSGMAIRIAASDRAIVDAANSAAAARIREFRPSLSLDELRLGVQEQIEGARLATVYEEFLRLWPTEAVTFSPAVRGNGIVNSCFADLGPGQDPVRGEDRL